MSGFNVSSTAQWIQFFRNAGLPANVAANYAIIFSDNRIQLNMLMDLSKEYLYDMGIKVMGDVIAILKYAKEYHNQLTKEKVLEDINPEKKINLSPDKKDTAVSRIVGHYTRPINNSSRSVTAPESYTMKQVYFEKKVPQKHMGDLKRRLEGTTRLLPIKKIRKVPPDDEGAYRIKMPTGSTARSRKILQQQKQIQAKGSVFNRLGDSVVSSSTDVSKNKVQSTSVFNRLGPAGGHNEVSTSTSLESQIVGTDNDEDVGRPLQYQGVLKGVTKNPRSKIIQLVNRKPTGNSSIQLYSSKTTGINRTVFNHSGLNTFGVKQVNNILSPGSPRAATIRQTSHTQGILGGASTFAGRQPVKNRLGRCISSSSTSLSGNRIIQNINRTNLNKSLKNKVNISRTVFQRLGV